MPRGQSNWNYRFGRTPAERLLNRSVVDPTCGCRLWQGSVDTWGYGHLGYAGRTIRAHAWAWMLANGKQRVPKGKIICHTCDTPRCIEPRHLYLGTHKSNTADKRERGRFNQAGEHNGRAKLTREQADAIRDDTRSGPVLAKLYGVNRSNINRIRRRTAWHQGN